MESSTERASDEDCSADCPSGLANACGTTDRCPHEASSAGSTASHISLQNDPLRWTREPPERVSFAVIGGGFSGLMTAVHALRAAPQATAVVFERLPRARPGVAYGGADETHLLNVRADRMGLASDEVGGFAAWLERRVPGRHAPSDFVPRRLFGDYLNERLGAMVEALRPRITLVRDDVIALRPHADGLALRLASGERTIAKATVLAVGLPAPRAPWASDADGVVDPWAPDAFGDLAADAPVIVVGTGLTALDVLVSLARRGHRGPVTCVSRNGRFPLPHADHAPPGAAALPVAPQRADLLQGPLSALRTVRVAALAAMAAGRPWQEAIDAVRPHTTAAWRAWSDRDRERFLARIRPLWEVHRHRAPRQVLALVEELRASGRLELLRGTPLRVEIDAGHRVVAVRTAAGEVVRRRGVRVFNCIGPAMRVSEHPDALMRSLLADGLVSTDAAEIGLRADGDGRTLDAAGVPRPDLFVLGALRRGDLWESTAVPELRVQAEAVGAALARLLTEAPAGLAESNR